MGKGNFLSYSISDIDPQAYCGTYFEYESYRSTCLLDITFIYFCYPLNTNEVKNLIIHTRCKLRLI